MEGVLAVPPDRGTIIGRALWKPRFVVVGPQKREQPGSSSSGRIPTPRESPGNPDHTYLSIYKSRSDVEPIQQYRISSITDCQVQMVAHRKQGPVLPTLVVTFAPDPATDKLRKRRSSRAAGLTSSSSNNSKESSANTLWFRSGDDGSSVHDWARIIQMRMQQPLPTRQHHAMSPMSPVTPSSPTFANPFAPRPRDPSDYYARPPSGNRPSATGRGTLQHKGSSQTQSSRDRPNTYSGSPSLRSKRSDISSHASVMNQSQHVSYTAHYGPMHPADLPSPATTIGDYHGEFIEGWTAAQGRSSTLSSPIQGRESVGSAVVPPTVAPTATMDSSSPPGPRETILDRAFQMRCIPGSETELPGEEKLTSLARFEALMKEMDKKREQRNSASSKVAPQEQVDMGLRSSWDSDEDSDSDEDGHEYDEQEGHHELAASGYAHRHDAHISPRHLGRSHSYSHSQGGLAHEADFEEPDVSMPPGTQRALEFIATGRSSPAISAARAMSPRSQRSPAEEYTQYNPSTLLPPMNNSGFSQSRPDLGPRRQSESAQRSYRQLQVAVPEGGGYHNGGTSCGSLASPVLLSNTHLANLMRPQHQHQSYVPSPSGKSGPTELAMTAAAMSSSVSLTSRRTTAEKRISGSSLKRLSISELTKRLSGTSSLLMMQTNTSSRGSSTDVADGGSPQQQQQQQQQQYAQQPRGAARPGTVPPPGTVDRDRYTRRSNAGVAGGDGGLL